MHTKIRMDTNIRNNTKKVSEKVIYPDLSFDLVGIFLEVRKEIGMYGREKQYADAIEKKLETRKVAYVRELRVSDSGNTLDFLIEEKIVLELKAKRMLTSEDYRQIQHYLQETQMRLGLLVNFRETCIKPVRIVRIDDAKKI